MSPHRPLTIACVARAAAASAVFATFAAAHAQTLEPARIVAPTATPIAARAVMPPATPAIIAAVPRQVTPSALPHASAPPEIAQTPCSAPVALTSFDRPLLRTARRHEGFDDHAISTISLIDESGERRVRMGTLAFLGSHKVNGVSALHTDLLRENLFGALNRSTVVRAMEEGLRAPNQPITSGYLRTLTLLSLYLQHPEFRPAQTPQAKGRLIPLGELAGRQAVIQAAMSSQLTVKNPWPGQQVEVVSGTSPHQVVARTSASDTFTFQARAGQSYLVEQVAAPTTKLAFAPVTGPAATADRHLGKVQIGLDPAGPAATATVGTVLGSTNTSDGLTQADYASTGEAAQTTASDVDGLSARTTTGSAAERLPTGNVPQVLGLPEPSSRGFESKLSGARTSNRNWGRATCCSAPGAVA